MPSEICVGKPDCVICLKYQLMGFLFQALYGQNARLLFVFVSLIVMYMREDQMRFISQISKLYQKHNDFVC